MEIQQLKFIKHLVRFNRHVYLDHNATTPVSSHVRHTMNHVLKNCYGNPSSLYGIARKSAEVMERARKQVADAIHADPCEVYFTGCATESNNAVLTSVSSHFYPKKRKIITTPIEHPSVISTLEHLKTQGIVVELCPVDHEGRVSPAVLEKMIDDDTFLICCMLANNEIGTIQDIAAIAKIAHEHNVLLLSDCVQAFGKIPIDVHGLGIDYASFSAHKLYGPKGVGAIFIKQGSPFVPFMHGGHQERGMRAGTESLHNIAGFGAACHNVGKLLAHADQVSVLKRQFVQQIKAIKPDCVINSPEADCLPNTVSVTFPGVRNAGLMAMLDYYGIAVSAGSACSTQEDKPSPVLKAIGLSDQAAKETIRISLGCCTSARDIRYTVKTIQKYIDGKSELVSMITPAQLTETMVWENKYYILDVRPQYYRNKWKSLPNSYEVSYTSIEKYLSQFPRNKPILVVCQDGYLAFVAAYYLKAQGFEQAGVLLNGLSGWKSRYCDVYRKHAGENVTVLKPGR
jgi:cysteine desulfurase